MMLLIICVLVIGIAIGCGLTLLVQIADRNNLSRTSDP